MDINELNRVFVDMGEKKKAAELNTLFAEFDTGHHIGLFCSGSN